MRVIPPVATWLGLGLLLLLSGCEKPEMPAAYRTPGRGPAPVIDPANDPILGKWMTPADGFGHPFAATYEFTADGTVVWAPREPTGDPQFDRQFDALDEWRREGKITAEEAGKLKRMYDAFEVTWRRQGRIIAITHRYDANLIGAELAHSVLFYTYFGMREEVQAARDRYEKAVKDVEEGRATYGTGPIEVEVGEHTRYLVQAGERWFPCDATGATRDIDYDIDEEDEIVPYTDAPEQP